MAIIIKEVKTRKDLRQFVYLPAKIHKDHKNWVPPLYSDEWLFYNPKRNKSFGYSDAVLALAYRNDEIVGRIMGIINHRYNDSHNEKNGRFSQMECWNDSEVAHALIEYIENWARSLGMEKLVGPLGFSDKEPQGFMIEGFDKPIVIASNANFEFMVNLIEKEGFTKEIDLVVFNVPIPEVIPEFYTKIYERSNSRAKVTMLEFTKRTVLKKYIRPVFRLVNETFADIYGFAPYEEAEMDDFANRYLAILDPRFIKIVLDPSGDVIAFIIGMPDISKGIIKSKGKLYPFGFIHILRSQKKTKQLNLLLGAIKDKYRGSGIDVMMGVKMLESCHKAGLENIDSHLELESNIKMHREMEIMNGKVYKRYRIFQKSLI